jgi:hypothetical protein
VSLQQFLHHPHSPQFNWVAQLMLQVTIVIAVNFIVICIGIVIMINIGFFIFCCYYAERCRADFYHHYQLSLLP